MTTTDPPAEPEFERIEWSSVGTESRLTGRDRGFLLSVVVLAGFAAYYSLVHPPDEPLPLLGFWEPLLVDWVFYGSLLIFLFYVVWPVVGTAGARAGVWRAVRSDAVALASLAWLGVFFVVGTFEPVLVGEIRLGPLNQPPVGFAVAEGYTSSCVGPVVGELCRGTLAHPLGTGGNGRDVLLLTLAGMRTALQMVLITAAIIVPVGLAVGTLAGYHGGWIDELLMRYVDAQQTIPALFIYIAAAVLYGPSLILMVVVFGLLNWGDVARSVRSEVLQVRESLFVTAARGAGLSHWRVIRHHLIPNVSASVLTVTALKLPLLVIIEASLSYLRFGDPRIVSWGNVVSVNLIADDPTLYWWVGAFPIGALVLTTLAISLVGNAMQDWLDPRQAGGSR